MLTLGTWLKLLRILRLTFSPLNPPSSFTNGFLTLSEPKHLVHYKRLGVTSDTKRHDCFVVRLLPGQKLSKLARQHPPMSLANGYVSYVLEIPTVPYR
jgi:hypothetical protein